MLVGTYNVHIDRLRRGDISYNQFINRSILLLRSSGYVPFLQIREPDCKTTDQVLQRETKSHPKIVSTTTELFKTCFERCAKIFMIYAVVSLREEQKVFKWFNYCQWVLLLFGEAQDFSEKAIWFQNIYLGRARFPEMCERNLQRARCDQIL